MFQPSAPPGLAPDEVRILDRRRHGIILVARLAAPGLVLLVPLLLIIWSLLTYGSDPAVADATIRLSTTAVYLLIVPLALWAGYNLYDWMNDTFHVTSRRVIRSERNFIFSEDLKEANLSQIQNVSVEIPNPLASLLNYGTVIIETAAVAGKIEFDSIPDPHEVQRMLFELRGIPIPPQPPSSVPEFSSVTALLRYLLPLAPIYAPNGSVTYHKHWFILVQALAWPLLLLVLVTFAAGASGIMSLLLLLLVIIPVLLYQYANWVNDIYILTDVRIIDIVRVPLIREERREALLEQIQNVSVTLPNLLSRILDMGTVLVETAGKAENFQFLTVAHPLKVKDEINRRLDAVRIGRKQAESQARRQEIETILDEFIRKQHSPPPGESVPPADDDGTTSLPS